MSSCYSSFIVGTFTLALVIYDMIQEKWDDTWKHALIGTALTGVFWLLCYFLDDKLTTGILVIPTLFFIVFALGILVTGESLKRQGCCVKCTSSTPTDVPGLPGTSGLPGLPGLSGLPGTPSVVEEKCEFNPQLKATPLL